ncbi:sulfated surface glycoprotein 185-like protein [Lates japonicus]|uniref:Sulfated surface glycoprotein 185-like protein n=1 Tax=Lates japonicus TaxID=270547 RepID=A0AAD3RIX8_LATJO|nr:sulfated surface glycoprotein 185-like protein [Lates japonicus]
MVSCVHGSAWGNMRKSHIMEAHVRWLIKPHVTAEGVQGSTRTALCMFLSQTTCRKRTFLIVVILRDGGGASYDHSGCTSYLATRRSFWGHRFEPVALRRCQGTEPDDRVAGGQSSSSSLLPRPHRHLLPEGRPPSVGPSPQALKHENSGSSVLRDDEDEEDVKESQAEAVAKRCGHSKPPNNRPFMMPLQCNDDPALPSTPPPPPCTSLHSCTGMWSNKLPAPLLLPAAATTIATTATTSPVLPPSQPKPLFPQIKKTKKARNYRGGVGREGGRTLQTEHKERIHGLSHTLPEKKEGDPFKCGAAALIHWVKMGEGGVTEEPQETGSCDTVVCAAMERPITAVTWQALFKAPVLPHRAAIHRLYSQPHTPMLNHWTSKLV